MRNRCRDEGRASQYTFKGECPPLSPSFTTLNALTVFDVALLMKTNVTTPLVAATIMAVMTAAGVAAEPSPSPTPLVEASPVPEGSPRAWDPFIEMKRMQNEMNSFFHRAMTEFNANPTFQTLRTEPGFSSSLEVRDKGDHYEIDASLPGADINSVKVTAEGNNMLRVTVTQSKEHKTTDKNSTESMTEFGRYEQLVTLPGPAKTREMKVERKEHEVVVTVPKAKQK